MHTDKQMNVSYQASLVNRHIRRFTGYYYYYYYYYYYLLDFFFFVHGPRTTLTASRCLEISMEYLMAHRFPYT